MHYVRALTDGVWESTAEHQANSIKPRPPRYLVRCSLPPGEEAVWSVNREGVEVERGLVVGFLSKEAADYMVSGHHPRKEYPRGEMVSVVKDMVVCFHDEQDALWAARTGRAIQMTPEEIYALVQQMQAQVSPGDTEPQGEPEPVIESEPPAVTAKPKVPTGKKKGKA